VAGARARDGRCARFVVEPAVGIQNLDDQRAAGRPRLAAASAHPGEKGRRIRLDALAPAAAIAALASAQLAVDERLVQHEVGRNAFEERDQGWTV
jgi:hypothetical protein